MAKCLRGSIAAFVSVSLSVAGVRAAHAGCNLIPGTAKTFNASLGATNRPFAAPGERLEVTLRGCDGASPGLSAAATDHVVTVFSNPPAGRATRSS